MALLAALCLFLHLPEGFRNRHLRAHVAALLGENLQQNTAAKMSYDLRRLRLKGLISRKAGTTSSLQTSAIVVAQNREAFAQQVGSFQIRLRVASSARASTSPGSSRPGRASVTVTVAPDGPLNRSA